jgi:hypothetical protein
MVRIKKIPTQLGKLKKKQKKEVAEPIFIPQLDTLLIQLGKREFLIYRKEVVNSELFRFHTSEDPQEDEPHWFLGLYKAGKVTDIYEYNDYTQEIEVSKWVRHGKFLNWIKEARK